MCWSHVPRIIQSIVPMGGRGEEEEKEEKKPTSERLFAILQVRSSALSYSLVLKITFCISLLLMRVQSRLKRIGEIFFPLISVSIKKLFQTSPLRTTGSKHLASIEKNCHGCHVRPFLKVFKDL